MDFALNVLQLHVNEIIGNLQKWLMTLFVITI
jgi:hypothetical protein